MAATCCLRVHNQPCRQPRRGPLATCHAREICVTASSSAAAGSSGPPFSVCRRAVLLAGVAVAVSAAAAVDARRPSANDPPAAPFTELGEGVTAVDIRVGTGNTPRQGQRLIAQGWVFASSDSEPDAAGFPTPYCFRLGTGESIRGLEVAASSMRVGGIRRAILPPPVSYVDYAQGPIPRDAAAQRRLYHTVFNKNRLANGEGATLGTTVFDIQLLSAT